MTDYFDYPSGEDTETRECEYCQGKGKGHFSRCTGELILSEVTYALNTKMCPHCGEAEHEEQCPECLGAGFFDVDEDEARDQALDREADLRE